MPKFPESLRHPAQFTCLVGGFGIRYILDKHQTVSFQLGHRSQQPRVRLNRFVRGEQSVDTADLEQVPWLLTYVVVESRKPAITRVPHEVLRRIERFVTGLPFDPQSVPICAYGLRFGVLDRVGRTVEFLASRGVD